MHLPEEATFQNQGQTFWSAMLNLSTLRLLFPNYWTSPEGSPVLPHTELVEIRSSASYCTQFLISKGDQGNPKPNRGKCRKLTSNLDQYFIEASPTEGQVAHNRHVASLQLETSAESGPLTQNCVSWQHGREAWQGAFAQCTVVSRMHHAMA